MHSSRLSGLLAAWALQLCACSGTGGPPDAGSELTGPAVLRQTCAASTESNACYKCEDEKCCQTYARCHANAECEAFKACLLACPAGEHCEESCTAQHPNGVSAWAPRLVCMTVHCGTACSSAPVPDCVTCINTFCADEYAVLESTPAGYLLQACIAACPFADAACIDGCKKKYQSAVQALDALATCSSQKCPMRC
jgi:hypothetical protein